MELLIIDFNCVKIFSAEHKVPKESKVVNFM